MTSIWWTRSSHCSLAFLTRRSGRLDTRAHWQVSFLTRTSVFVLTRLCVQAVVYLNVVTFASHEVDDGFGQCCSEPEHKYGQHTETVRRREEQSRRKTSQWQTGTFVTEAQRGESTSYLCSTYSCTFGAQDVGPAAMERAATQMLVIFKIGGVDWFDVFRIILRQFFWNAVLVVFCVC